MVVYRFGWQVPAVSFAHKGSHGYHRLRVCMSKRSDGFKDFENLCIRAKCVRTSGEGVG